MVYLSIKIFWRTLIMRTVSVMIQYKNTRQSIKFGILEICPHCGKSMSPRIHAGVSESDYGGPGHDNTAALLLSCVVCDMYFTRMFRLNELNKYGLPVEVELSYNPPVDAKVPEEIDDISEKFSDIYMQSLKAKQAGLDQIYGMGLRKALEFLAKDFAIHLEPEKKEEITKNQLGYVIKNFFKDYPNIIKLFQAASWIGNDEVHYDRKIPNEDAETILQFISVIMMQVSSQLIYEKAAKLVDSSAKPETKS